MKRNIVRSELLRLRDRLRSAVAGRELLDRKREAILRAIADRAPRLRARQAAATERLHDARAAIVRAQLEMGRTCVDAAVLAQPTDVAIPIEEGTVVGVRVPQASRYVASFAPEYGDASGSPALHQAGVAFAEALGPLVSLAADETAMRRLTSVLARTAKRLNALDKQLIPEIRRDIHDVASALEEEERDDAVRRRTWQAKQASHRRGV
jgi:V/A-type H+-transporting ATPase subunit D